MLDLVLILLMPFILFIGILLLLDYYLKKKYNPDKELLLEMNQIKSVKKLDIACRIALFLFIILPSEDKFTVIKIILFTISFVMNAISIYVKLKNLGNVEEYSGTRKYIMSELYMSMGIYLLATGIIFYIK